MLTTLRLERVGEGVVWRASKARPSREQAARRPRTKILTTSVQSVSS